jgi:signal transduction histidine kinase
VPLAPGRALWYSEYEMFFIWEQPGHGLGLWIVKQLVRAHRGQLSLESTPGLGSTIRVELPT